MPNLSHHKAACKKSRLRLSIGRSFSQPLPGPFLARAWKQFRVRILDKSIKKHNMFVRAILFFASGVPKYKHPLSFKTSVTFQNNLPLKRDFTCGILTLSVICDASPTHPPKIIRIAVPTLWGGVNHCHVRVGWSTPGRAKLSFRKAFSACQV